MLGLVRSARSIFMWLCVALTLFCAVPALAEGEAEAAKNLTAILKNLNTSDAALTKQLALLKPQLDKLLNNNSDKDVLKAAADIIKRDAGRSEIATEVEALRKAVEGYQDDLPLTHITTLATSLETALKAYTSEYPAAVLSRLSDVAQQIAPIQAQRPKLAMKAQAGALSALISGNGPVNTGEIEIPELAGLRALLVRIEAPNFRKAIRNRAKELTDLLQVSTSDRAPLSAEETARLRTVAGLIDGAIPPVNQVVEITGIAGQLDTALRAYTGEYPEASRSRFNAVQILLEAIEERRPNAAITRRASALNALVENTPPVRDGAVILANLATLRATLITVESNHFLSALGQRMTDLQTLLSVPQTDRPTLRVADKIKLRRLKTAIDQLLPTPTSTGIHVISAQFGRISGPKAAGGRCNAITAMRQACQGKPSCTLPTSGTAAFCGGEDPAPFAQSKHKGLAIRYICLTADSATWNAILASNSTSFGGRAQSAVLRTGEDSIFCQKPQ